MFLKVPQFYRHLQENMTLFSIGKDLTNVSASTVGNFLLLLRAQTDPVFKFNSVTCQYASLGKL